MNLIWESWFKEHTMKTIKQKRGRDFIVREYLGEEGELILNQDTKRIHLQDGITKGGFPHALLSDIPESIDLPNVEYAKNSQIPSNTHFIYLAGKEVINDGQGGLYTDIDNGSLNTFTSADGRTWFLVEDIGEERLALPIVSSLKNISSRASIQHIRTTNYNYDITTIWGGVNSIRKIKGLDFRERDGASKVASLRNRMRANGFNAGVNCDASFQVGDGYYAQSGLQIIDGVAYQNFTGGPQPYPELMQENILMMNDGRMVAASIFDGKTAQDYVNEGAVWSAGWGAMLVKNGQKTVLPLGDFFTQLSARTVIGQRANGEYVIITVEGKTNSYGISMGDMQDLCISHGMHIAMNLDGGGSSQMWWKGGYSMPSSDSTPRNVGNFLAIDTAQMSDFDTQDIEIGVTDSVNIGNIAVRQINNTVSIFVSLDLTIPSNQYVVINNNFPARFRPRRHIEARGVVHGSLYRLIGIGLDSTMETLNLRAHQGEDEAAYGLISYPSKWSA